MFLSESMLENLDHVQSKSEMLIFQKKMSGLFKTLNF